MSKLTKRKKGWESLSTPNKSYPVAEALGLVKKAATAKFDESIDVAVNLGIDAKKSDQTVRGAVVLPAGTGKKVRVAVFAQGDKAAAAKAAGAELVGMEDLAEQVKAGNLFSFSSYTTAPKITAERNTTGSGGRAGPALSVNEVAPPQAAIDALADVGSTPALSRYGFGLGRRRSWMLVTQIGLLLTLPAFGFFAPQHGIGFVVSDAEHPGAEAGRVLQLAEVLIGLQQHVLAKIQGIFPIPDQPEQTSL